jgi:hypothetical protein
VENRAVQLAASLAQGRAVAADAEDVLLREIDALGLSAEQRAVLRATVEKGAKGIFEAAFGRYSDARTPEWTLSRYERLERQEGRVALFAGKISGGAPVPEAGRASVEKPAPAAEAKMELPSRVRATRRPKASHRRPPRRKTMMISA